MGRARDAWGRLSVALEKQDVDAIGDLYTVDAIYLEPQNPPHEGNLLIQAYLNSWLQARENIDITTQRVLESDDGRTVAVEWVMGYAAGGRRWSISVSSWLELSDTEDAFSYHRDYY